MRNVVQKAKSNRAGAIIVEWTIGIAELGWKAGAQLHPMQFRIVGIHRILFIAAALAVQGCADGNLTRRNDGKTAPQVTTSISDVLHQEAVRAEVQRLRKESPGLSRKEAWKQARKKVGAPISAGGSSSGISWKELKRQRAQQKLEAELAEMRK
jgi:hypothetical protein